VLAQYVAQGVDELDADKLSPLLKLKYRNAIADAFAELGRSDQVRRVFVGFQRHLYSAWSNSLLDEFARPLERPPWAQARASAPHVLSAAFNMEHAGLHAIGCPSHGQGADRQPSKKSSSRRLM
jgi:hypothetical protein